MANPKKGALHQFLVVFTKTGDGSFARGITASAVSKCIPRYFGVATGASTVAGKGSLAKAASLVRSGVFRQTLNTTETNFDQVIIQYDLTSKSCAEQHIPITFETFNDVDLSAIISDTHSQTVLATSAARKGFSQAIKSYSAALLTQSLASDTHSLTVLAKSAAQQGASRALIAQSLASDVHSLVVHTTSAARKGFSQAIKSYSAALLTQSLASDTHSLTVLAKSAAQQAASRALIVQSLASDTHSLVATTRSRAIIAASAAQEGSSRALLVQSLASDTHSQTVLTTSAARKGFSQAIKSYSAALLTQSLASDTHSLVAVTKSAAQMAASRTVLLQSLISDTHSLVASTRSRTVIAASAAQQGSSRTLLVQSLASDTHSLTARSYSAAVQAGSRTLLVQSLASDTHSQTLRTYSQATKIYSAVGGLSVTLADSDISQIADQVASAVGAGVASQVWALSDASQVLSAAKQANARTLINQSLISDTHSLVVKATSAARQANSRAIYVQSLVSDVDSAMKSQYQDLSAVLSDLGSLIIAGAATGFGAIEWSVTLVDGNSIPIGDADVWITTDIAGTNVIASGRTDQNGVVKFYLDAGTVYVWVQKSGWNFTNPTTATVS